jgi:hypothetical protein
MDRIWQNGAFDSLATIRGSFRSSISRACAVNRGQQIDVAERLGAYCSSGRLAHVAAISAAAGSRAHASALAQVTPTSSPAVALGRR